MNQLIYLFELFKMQVFSMDSDHRGNREHDLFPKLMLNIMKLLCTDMQMFDLFENS